MMTLQLVTLALLCALTAGRSVARGPTTEATPVTDPSEDGTVQGLVCTQILSLELPYLTFRREVGDGWSHCRCVSPKRARCQPETPYPTVAPGTPSAALAQEHRPQGSASLLTWMHAFQIQQQCFFNYLTGGVCAFSWEERGRPACDCAKEVKVELEATAEEEVISAGEAPMEETPVEETSTEGKPVEESPAEEKPTEELPAMDGTQIKQTNEATQAKPESENPKVKKLEDGRPIYPQTFHLRGRA